MADITEFGRGEDQSVPIFSTGAYRGVDLTSYDELLIASGKAAGGQNFVTNRVYGALKPIRGRTILGEPVYPTQSILSLTRFLRSQTGFPTPVVMLSQTNPNFGPSPYQSSVFVETNVSGPFSVITLPFLNIGGSPIVTTSPTAMQFLQAGTWMFFCNRDPNAMAYKSDAAMNFTFWQIAPPVVDESLSPTVYPGGNITDPGVQYVITYANAILESSATVWVQQGPGTPLPPPAVNQITTNPNNLFSVSSVPPPLALTNQAVTFFVPVSPDPQVTQINVYRISTANPQFLFIGSVPNIAGSQIGVPPGANLLFPPSSIPPGFAYFVDNLPDSQVVGYPLTPRRDPPAPFYCMCYHKGYVFGFGHDAFQYVSQMEFAGSPIYVGQAIAAGPNDLWYSNQAEPWAFDSVTQVVPIAPNDYSNYAQACGSIGGALFLLCFRSCWVFYGDNPDDFQVAQEVGHNLGCVAAGSFVQALGVGFWLSNQGIMMFDGTNLTMISADIKEFLDSLTTGQLEAADAHFDDGIYWITFPNFFPPGDSGIITYGYVVSRQEWVPSSYAWTVSYFDLDDPSFRNGDAGALDYVIADVAGLVPVTLTQLYIGQNDTVPGGTGDTTVWASGLWRPKDYSWWTFEFVEVEIPVLTSASIEVTITLVVNPGFLSEQIWVSPPISASTYNPALLFSLPMNMQGMRAQLFVQAVTPGDFTMGEVIVYGSKKRKFDQGDSR